MTAQLGLGTYRVRSVHAAGRTACASGPVWIDTAPNYANGHAHSALRGLLATHPTARAATKTGFFTPLQGCDAANSGVLTAAQRERGHCLAPTFVRWQTLRSLAELGRIDVVFVHNPEHAAHDLKTVAATVRDAFAALEELADDGSIGGYGVATWSGFTHGVFSVRDLLTLAREASGGTGHRLTAVQQPVSLVLSHPIALALDGRGPLIEARSAGVKTFASAPLHGGQLLSLVTPELVEFIRPGMSHAAACLLSVASCPSLDVVLTSASTPGHWQDASQAVADPLPPQRLRSVLDVLATR